jgi:DNA-directed RNA polymerase
MTTQQLTYRLGSVLTGREYDEQLERERECIASGSRRYHELVKDATARGDGGALKPEQSLLSHWLRPYAALLKSDFDELMAKPPQARTPPECYVAPPISRMIGHHETVGAVVIRAALDMLLEEREVTMRRLVHRIGTCVFGEIHARALLARDEQARRLRKERVQEVAAADKVVFDRPEEMETVTWLVKRFERLGPAKVNFWARRKLTVDEMYTRGAVHLGQWLFAKLLAVASCRASNEGFKPAFEMRRVQRRGKHQARVYRLTREVLDILERGHDQRALLRPERRLMACEPTTWENGVGGYLLIRVPPVKKMWPAHRAAMKTADTKRFYEAQRVIDGAAWRVNPWVLSVANKLVEKGGGVAGMPSNRPAKQPKPPKETPKGTPQDERFAGVDPEMVKQYRREYGEWKDAEKGRMCQWITLLRKMDVANTDATKDRLYAPHQPDFRGRMYAMPSLLNHQQEDLSRALMMAADSKPVTDEESTRILYIYAANLWANGGLDKKPLNDRIQWVNDNAAEIERAVRDPVANDWWMQADGGDKAWQFLAVCYALCDHEREGSPGSHQLVQADGTNNGQQHYAALMRDESMARAVNLMHSDAPNDPYLSIVQAVRERAMRDAKQGGWHGQVASTAYPFIDRKTVKQPAMTYYYDATPFGMREQILAKLYDRDVARQTAIDASRYLSATIRECMAEVNQSAEVAMTWIKGCAKIIAKAGHILEWTTPMGWPVVQGGLKYLKCTKTKMNVYGNIMLVWKKASDKPEPMPGKQVRGSAPNFIHSLDATHFLLTAEYCGQMDSPIFISGIHDCYQTHAATAGTMGYALRQAFVDLYANNDRLAELRAEWTNRYGLELPPSPQGGSFDVRAVMKSPHFFSLPHHGYANGRV